MATFHKNQRIAINNDSLQGVTKLSTDNLRETQISNDMLNTFSKAENVAVNMSGMQTNRIAMPSGMHAFLSRVILPLLVVFVLGAASTAILKADGQDEEGYIHKPKLVLWEEYYREWLDIEHMRMFGRPWDPNTQGSPDFFWNPDSVMVDVNWGECDWTYQPYVGAIPPVPDLPKWFKRGIELYFDCNLIPRKEIYEDGRVLKYTIDDILPKYKETIEGFRELEKIVGTFHFEDMLTMYPDTTEYIPDEQSRTTRRLFVVFDNYVFDSHHGQILGLQESKYGLIDIEKAFGKIKFVQEPSFDIYSRFFGHNNIFMVGGYDNVEENILPLFISPMITSDYITLSLPEALTIFPKSIKIVDSLGNTVKLFNTGINTQQVLNVSNLPAGRYFVQIDNYVGSFIVR